MEVKWRRRSDTHAHRRNSALNHVGRRIAGKSTICAEMGQYTESSDEVIVEVIRLPRKPANVNFITARTANRHRWSRRKY